MIHQLSTWVRIDILLRWARKFANPTFASSNPGIAEVIKSITLLDLSHYLKIQPETFCNLVHLPFSPSLAHLNLSQTPIGKSPTITQALAHPTFQHLVSLNLEDTQLKNIDPLLFNAPHTFPNLHTLNLSNNSALSIPTIGTTNKFPNLKVLNIINIPLDEATVEGFLIDETTDHNHNTTTTPAQTPPEDQQAPFQLEKLFIRLPVYSSSACSSETLIDVLSRSPHLSQLRELYLTCKAVSPAMISELFDPECSVLKNLTVLDFGKTDFDHLALASLGQSSLLSNLTTLNIMDFVFNTKYFDADLRKEAIQQFIQSPFLWGPQFKHLSLCNISKQLFEFDHLAPALDAANVKLETLNLTGTTTSLYALGTASSLSNLHSLTFGPISDLTTDVDTSTEEVEKDGFQTFIQSPTLSHLQSLNLAQFHYYESQFWGPDHFAAILSSSMMSNDLVELNLSYYQYPLNDVVKILCTQPTIPRDPTAPLKFGKLRKLFLLSTNANDADLKLIVDNLKGLTHIDLSQPDETADPIITDKTIAALLSTERNDPYHLYTSLPDLVSLKLAGCSIGPRGCVALSKSQLLDQLEVLDLSNNPPITFDAHPFNNAPRGQTKNGPQQLLTTLFVSNLKTLNLAGLDYWGWEASRTVPKSRNFKKYLGNCRVDLD